MAALISVPTIVYATYFFGNHVDRVVRVVKRIQFGVIGTILFIIAFIVIKTWWARKREMELETESAVADAIEKIEKKHHLDL